MSQKLACITLDMEPDYGDPDGHIRLLENPGYFELYTGIINKYSAKVTMFTVASLLERYAGHFKTLAEKIPLELFPHSYSHDPQVADSLEEIRNSVKAFREFSGEAPVGYRAPYGQITKQGLAHLMEAGFLYDSSVYPSFRPGRFGYSNLDKPNMPFRVTNGERSLIEFPFTSLSGVRIVFSLSYVKLLGWGLYSTLWRAFGLPEIALALSHPHDFYFHEVAPFHKDSLEKTALARNAKRGFVYFDRILNELKHQGYVFMHLSEIYRKIISQEDIQQFPLKNWK